MGDVYRRADLYGIAFDFRDVPRECDFLTWVGEELGRGAASFLECGCGPGYHVVDMARRGIRACGLDQSAEMLANLQRRAAATGVAVDTLRQDMRAIRSEGRFDVAAILMDTAACLLGTDDLLAHLRALAAHQSEGAVYVLEMAHPSNHFGTARTSENHWTLERDGVKVTTTWGFPEDPFDALTQIDEVRVVMDVERADGSREHHEERTRSFRWTRPHFESVVAASGVYEIAAWFGSLDARIPAGNQKEAWRMVPVLRRMAEGGPEGRP